MAIRKVLIKPIIVILMLITLCSCGSRTVEEAIITNDSDYNFLQYRNNYCSSEEVLYFNISGQTTLLFYDKESGTCAPLCGKPECNHTSTDCNAYCALEEGLCLYNGLLYSYDASQNEVICRNIDGTNKKTVRSVNTMLMAENFTGTIYNSCSAFHEGWFYFSAGVGEVNAGITTQSARVIAFPLDSDAEGTLIYSSDEYEEVAIEPYGEYIYIMAYTDFSDGSNMEIVKYAIETGENETIYEGERPFSYHRFLVTKNAIIFGDGISDEYTVYSLIFGDNIITTLYDGKGYYTYGFIDENVLLGMPTINGFNLCVKDLSDNTLMSVKVDYKGLAEGYMVYPVIMGSDDDYIYIDALVWSNEYPYESIIAVSLDGKEQITLWSNAEEVNVGEYVWN